MFHLWQDFWDWSTVLFYCPLDFFFYVVQFGFRCEGQLCKLENSKGGTDSQALSSSVCVLCIILMKMAFIVAAFCELSKGSYDKIATWKSDSHFNFELCNNIAGPERNQSKIFFPL